MANVMLKHASDLQTIVITHLPQIAAKANHHYSIYKTFSDQRMETKINILDDDARILSIAGMLSDDEITPFAIEQAKQLLK